MNSAADLECTSNADLIVDGLNYSRADLAIDLERVVDTIEKLTLTGVDLSAWFEREQILNQLLDDSR